MKIKTDTVKTVIPNGTWEGSYGLMYKFEILMNNGDRGEYSSKSKDQDKFIEGKEVAYHFIDGNYPKIKPHYEMQKKADPNKMTKEEWNEKDRVKNLIMARIVGVKSAVKLCNTENLEIDFVIKNAEALSKFILQDLDDVEETVDNMIKKDNNYGDLPF
tara:strand:- start:140 stop:616 length:477 start_codon:yes stop_codon:yes gene_type:complete